MLASVSTTGFRLVNSPATVDTVQEAHFPPLRNISSKELWIKVTSGKSSLMRIVSLVPLEPVGGRNRSSSIIGWSMHGHERPGHLFPESQKLHLYPSAMPIRTSIAGQNAEYTATIRPFTFQKIATASSFENLVVSLIPASPRLCMRNASIFEELRGAWPLYFKVLLRSNQSELLFYLAIFSFLSN